MEQDYYGADDYGAEISATQRAINEAAGEENAYRNRALQAQMASAKAAQKNAYRIAQLQAKTQRYGIDVNERIELENRKERAREFDAEHGLEIAKAYVAYSATPDLMWSRNDFVSAMGRVGQGGGMPAPIATSGTQPTPKGWQDFSAIAQYNGSQVPGGGSQPTAQSASSGGGSGSTTTDPRVSAANAIMKAVPPSASGGADQNDYAALSAIRSMYEAAQPGSLEDSVLKDVK